MKITHALAGFALLIGAHAHAAAPASRVAKPPTYAELKAEVERLRAELAAAKADLAKLRPAPAKGDAVRVGMTLDDLRKAASGEGHPPMTMTADDGKTQTFTVIVFEDTGADAVTPWRYTVDVQGGKVASFTRREDR